MIHTLSTSDESTLALLRKRFFVPPAESHKGQNGKLLIIGGSELFHAASLWAAEISSHIVDMVHYSSSKDNNDIFLSLKKTFRNGIVIPQKEIPWYAGEDDVILMGPGMVRTDDIPAELPVEFSEILALENEALFTRALTRYLISTLPDKQFIFDAGALQMMDPNWLLELNTPAIVTPHQLEFERVFGVNVRDLSHEQKAEVVRELAGKYNCVILLKAIVDVASDGKTTYTMEGGNQGLTKGGTGDVLAGMVASFATKTDPLISAVMGSYVLKRTADELSGQKGYWYNISGLIDKIPETLKQLM